MLGPKKKKSEKVKLSKESYRKARGIFSYLKPYSFVFFIGWIFLVLSTTAGLIFPYLMGKLLGSTGQSQNLNESVRMIDMDNINTVAISLFVLFALKRQI